MRRVIGRKLGRLCAGALACAVIGMGAVGPASAGPTVQIDIENYAYTPQDITVAKGTTVVWVNHDSMTHTVAADTPHFESPPLETDDKFTKTFNEPGVFTYVCTQHGRMSGTVTVK